MPAPPNVLELIERFRLHRESYQAAAYKESQLRQEFIDPLLRALGWDVDNEQGFAEAYKDVIHEDAIKVGGRTKAPDYCLRIGGTRKFFLEAKKPSVNIQQDASPAYQLRRYAWSSKLPLSVLTDFEEFAVYDCRIKPHQNDKASVARVMFFGFEELAEKWDEFAAIFSREAILKGSFDRYAETNKRKRGTAEVDAAFLAEIESWREELAKNLALRNEIEQRDLNFAVQRIIDRIIFLRIAEDRGIEEYGRLQSLLNGDKAYRRLVEMFYRADERYNSGIFHFEADKERDEPPDELTTDLQVDDKVVKEIVRHLYYPESPYEFSVLSADILGQVYEQFLGKVISLTSGHRAKVEEKPEVKKAGGVYYTPTYIVDYIVEQTVGKLLEGKTPKQASKLRVLDPACGSGSFLIGAYQYLLDWHLKWYIENDPANRKDIYQDHAGVQRLTLDKRKEILLDNIYGVDIDAQAVEVTKLSLLLKVLEGVNRESIDRQLKIFHKHRALPDLGKNIKCGNSLIGPDFYHGRQLSLLDDEDRYRVNAFDWSGKDGFQAIMKSGGFDAVIGNPPYVRQESISEFKSYFSKHYETFDSTADLYVYFVERALKLTRPNGFQCFIVSSSFLRSNFGRRLRQFVAKNGSIVRLTDFGGLSVFAAAKDTYVCVPCIKRDVRARRIEVARITELPQEASHILTSPTAYSVPSKQFSANAWQLEHPKVRALFNRIATTGVPLGTFVNGEIYMGVKTGLNAAFEIDDSEANAILESDKKAAEIVRRFLGGQDIRHYAVLDRRRFLIAIPNGWTRKAMGVARKLDNVSETAAWRWLRDAYPSVATHLQPFANEARCRRDQGQYWWELRPCDYYDKLDQPKIIYPDIAKSPRFALEEGSTWIRNTAYFLSTSDKYLLGLLNSKLLWFCLARIAIPFGVRAGEFRYRLFSQYVKQLPVHVSRPEDKSRRNEIVSDVTQMIELQRRLPALRSGHAKTVLERQIEAVDRQIDQLVYELYGLTDEEIRLVEESLTS